MGSGAHTRDLDYVGDLGSEAPTLGGACMTQALNRGPLMLQVWVVGPYVRRP